MLCGEPRPPCHSRPMRAAVLCIVGWSAAPLDSTHETAGPPPGCLQHCPVSTGPSFTGLSQSMPVLVKPSSDSCFHKPPEHDGLWFGDWVALGCEFCSAGGGGAPSGKQLCSPVNHPWRWRPLGPSPGALGVLKLPYSALWWPKGSLRQSAWSSPWLPLCSVLRAVCRHHFCVVTRVLAQSCPKADGACVLDARFGGIWAKCRPHPHPTAAGLAS